MLSITNRAAACLTGFALSGCMQSMPTADTLTRPTVEAFARLSSWTPWKPTPEQPPPLVVAESQSTPMEAAPAVQPAEQLPAAKPREPQRRPVSIARAAAAPRLSTAKTIPVVVPANLTVPQQKVVPAVVQQQGAAPLPANVSCQTSNQPGQRVRMWCTPVE